MKPFISRQFVYPFLFFIRREHVLKFQEQLEFAQWNDLEKVESKQYKRLEEIVSHFWDSRNSYQKRMVEKGFGSGRINGKNDIERLPITGKEDLRKDFRDLNLTPTGFGRYSIRLTGGSTGIPCMVAVDNHTSARSLAARALCQGWYGIEIGDRQARFWGQPVESGKLKAKYKDFALNRIRLDSLDFESKNLNSTIKRLQGFGVEFLYGYASLIQRFADQITERALDSISENLKAVISTSETLVKSQQDKLSQFFPCPVVNEYGCSEVDIISFQCPEGGNHIISENLLVEVQRFGNEPDGFGSILVTDLHNRIMPVIRYKVGDLAPLGLSQCSCGRGWPCLGNVLGRSQGQYVVVPDKGLVHSQFIVYMIEDLVLSGNRLHRFKIIQEQDFSLTVQVEGKVGQNLDVGEIINHLRSEGAGVLGEMVHWKVEVVGFGEISSGETGKYSHFESKVPHEQEQ